MVAKRRNTKPGKCRKTSEQFHVSVKLAARHRFPSICSGEPYTHCCETQTDAGEKLAVGNHTFNYRSTLILRMCLLRVFNIDTTNFFQACSARTRAWMRVAASCRTLWGVFADALERSVVLVRRIKASDSRRELLPYFLANNSWRAKWRGKGGGRDTTGAPYVMSGFVLNVLRATTVRARH